MDQSEHLLLVNNETKENHRLLESECVIGRGWLNCVDKRISRKHGILKLISNNSVSLTSTHRNPIFYKTKNDEILQMTHEEGESFVLSPGDSFGLLSNAFWFEIVKSNMQSDIQKSADVSSIVKSSPNESAAAVPKRKLPAWMNGNSSKKLRSDDNAVNVPGDGDITVAMDENSTEPSNRVPSVVEQVGRDLVLKTPEMESVAKDFDLKRKLPATNDANDNKKMCSDDDGVTAPNDGNITAATDDKSTEMYNPGSAVQDLVLETPSKGSAVADDNETMSCNEASASSSGDNGSAATTIDANAATDNAESAVAEPDVQMDTSKHSDENESAELTNEIEPVSDDAIEVSCEPIEDSNASKSDEKAAEPMPNDGQDVPDAEVADDTPHVEPATSTAANIAADSDDEYDGVPLPKIVIKTEPIDDIEPNVSDNVAVAGPSGTVTIKQEIKTEVKTEPDSSTDSKEQKRDCCRYGVTCYRRNPAHRIEMAHPGDIDYRLPSYGDPWPGAPPCPFGVRCYRRNPTHFQQFSHPPSTDPAANRKALIAKKVENSRNNENEVDDDDSDDDDEDPFAGGEDSDDPDFLGDLSSEDGDEEDSGNDTADTSSETD